MVNTSGRKNITRLVPLEIFAATRNHTNNHGHLLVTFDSLATICYNIFALCISLSRSTRRKGKDRKKEVAQGKGRRRETRLVEKKKKKESLEPTPSSSSSSHLQQLLLFHSWGGLLLISMDTWLICSYDCYDYMIYCDCG